MKAKLNLLVLALMGAALATPAMAEEPNPWMVRARVLNLKSDNGNSPDVGLAVSNKTFPEVDISYFITPNVSAELILTYPQKHDVILGGSKIGTVKHLPPTLLAQYRFMPGNMFNPYVGAGLNYTRFMNADLPAGISVSKNSFGLAFQLGADVEIAKNVYLNLDYKRALIQTDVSVGGNKLTTLKIDPNLYSVGIGYRF